MLSIIKRFISLVTIILISPLIVILFLIIVATLSGPFIFKQKRAGKNKIPFTIYKIRTMVADAENLRSKINHLNEADGPVFKIRNDPRYTKIGKFLSHTGLDEIPQLINIIKGEMDFVGPRPLPVAEANKVPRQYERRFSILPGMTSPWIIRGAHNLSFDQWMKLDFDYVDKKNLLYDLQIFLKTLKIVTLLIIRNNQ